MNIFNLFIKILIEKQRSRNTAKTEDNIENILTSLNTEERKSMGLADEEKYKKRNEYKLVAKRCIEKTGDLPIAFFDLNEYENNYNAVVATRNDAEYRGKGYALKVINEGLDWYNKNKPEKPIVWWAEKNNLGSQKLAEKAGFKRDLSIEDSDDEWIKNNWVKYIYN